MSDTAAAFEQGAGFSMNANSGLLLGTLLICLCLAAIYALLSSANKKKDDMEGQKGVYLRAVVIFTVFIFLVALFSVL